MNAASSTDFTFYFICSRISTLSRVLYIIRLKFDLADKKSHVNSSCDNKKSE